MKIERIEPLIADAGWRTFSFLKMTTACGITGWAEYNEDFGSKGLSAVISALAPMIIGMDPRRSEAVLARLHVATRQTRGGINQQAIAAIENALLDIRGKDAGKPVSALFGGPIRERIPVYWSHFATYRVAHRGKGFLPELETYEDLARHAAVFAGRGQRAATRGSSLSMSWRVWARISSSPAPSGRRMNLEIPASTYSAMRSIITPASPIAK